MAPETASEQYEDEGFLEQARYFFGLMMHYGIQREKSLMAYRGDWIVGFITSILATGVNVIFIWVLFQNIPDLKGWSFNELIMMYGFSQFSWGIFTTFSMRWTIRFAERYIIEGYLDRILLRPLHPLFQLSMENINLRSGLLSVVKGLVMIWYAQAAIAEFQFTVFTWIFAVGMALLGGAIYSAMFSIFAAISFWLKDKAGMVSPLFTLSNAARWPLPIFGVILEMLLTWLIPLGFVAFYPSAILLRPENFGHMLWGMPVMAAVTFALTWWVFSMGVHRYESTGS